MRWAAVAIAALSVFVSACLRSPASAHARPAAAKKCTRTIVGGRPACVCKGDRCKKRFQDDYLSAGLSCRRGRLRKPTIEDRRGPEPVLIGKGGRLSLETALAAFDTGIADLPGVKPKAGAIGNLGDGSLVFNEIQTHLNKLTKKQRAVVEQVTTPAPDGLEVPVDDAAAARLDRAALARLAGRRRIRAPAPPRRATSS
jgi:hypothetical protein